MPYAIKARMKSKSKGSWAPFSQTRKRSIAKNRAASFRQKYPRMNFRVQLIKKLVKRE